jgi:hypothetical protein
MFSKGSKVLVSARECILDGSMIRPTAARWRFLTALIAVLISAHATHAGPPYLTDDPEPVDLYHFEIFFFNAGTATRSGVGSSAGIDFNYGLLPETQLDIVVPAGLDSPLRGPTAVSLGNIQLAIKYRFIHQQDHWLDVSAYPRVFLPAASNTVGANHVSVFLPIWIERDMGPWTTFGGGGYEFNQGEGTQSFYQLGWALTRQFAPDFQLGAEVYHQSADAPDVQSTTSIDLGCIYDLTDNYHLMGSIGPGVQNAKNTDLYSWYVALQWTF